MVRFKVFIASGGIYTAADLANAWLDENPNVEILQMEYRQVRYSDHSICIMYKEKSNAKP